MPVFAGRFPSMPLGTGAWCGEGVDWSHCQSAEGSSDWTTGDLWRLGFLWTAGNGVTGTVQQNGHSSWVFKNNQVGVGTCKKSPQVTQMASPQEGPVWCFFGTFRWIQEVLFLSHHIGCMVIESLNMMWTLIMILIEHHWTSYVPGCHPSCISIVCIPFRLNICNMKTAMTGYWIPLLPSA